jgi:hypothetical protein
VTLQSGINPSEVEKCTVKRTIIVIGSATCEFSQAFVYRLRRQSSSSRQVRSACLNESFTILEEKIIRFGVCSLGVAKFVPFVISFKDGPQSIDQQPRRAGLMGHSGLMTLFWQHRWHSVAHPQEIAARLVDPPFRREERVSARMRGR